MDLLEAYRRSVTEFTDRVVQIDDELWTAPTPCSDWNVRELVNHVVSEERWVAPLFAGATVAESRDRFSGDLLGSDPIATAVSATAEAERVISEPGALDRTVHLSRGPTPAREYVQELLANHLVHGWDLAVAIGTSRQLDVETVHECAVWFAGAEQRYRDSGLIGPRVDVGADATEQDRLLAAYGRDPAWRPPH